MGKRRRLSKKELKGQGRMQRGKRSKRSLKAHMRKQQEQAQMMRRSSKPWRQRDSDDLMVLLELGPRHYRWRWILEAHSRLLRTSSYAEHVQSTLFELYERVPYKLLKRLLKQINSPQQAHVLLPLTRYVLHAPAREQRAILSGLSRLGVPEACRVAWFLFDEHGNETRRSCLFVIEKCGTRGELEKLDSYIERGESWAGTRVFGQLKDARKAIIERYPEDSMLAQAGSLSVSDDDAFGGLSLHEQAMKFNVDIHTELEQLLTHQTPEERRAFSFLAEQRRAYALKNPAGGGRELSHDVFWGGPLLHKQVWVVVCAIFLATLLAPQNMWLWALYSVGWGVYVISMWYWLKHRQRVLVYGRLHEAALVHEEQGYKVEVRGESMKPMVLDRVPSEIESLVESNASKQRFPVLVHRASEKTDVIFLWQIRELMVSRTGDWVLRRVWPIAIVVAFAVIAFLRLCLMGMAGSVMPIALISGLVWVSMMYWLRAKPVE